MSFSNLPLSVVLVGALVIAVALFALQWLRPRTKVVKVATAQFWQQAAQQAPARVLWQKFHYWLALLLSLAIALLLWLALSGVQRQHDNDAHLSLFFLDNSVAMQVDGRLSEAKKRLLQDVANSQPEQRQVWLGGAAAMMLLREQDNNALLGPKLVAVKATAHRAVFSSWLAAMQQQYRNRQIDLYYYGASLNASELAAVPTQIHLHARYAAPALTQNMGIVALGQAPAQSGLWGKVDVMFTLYASDARPLSANLVKFSLDGKWFQPTDIRALGNGRFVIRDMDVSSVPQQLQLSLVNDDDFVADDSATLTLASTPVIKLQLATDLPAWLRTLVQLDSGIRIVQQQPDVVICQQADSQCPQAPAQLLLNAATNSALFSAAGEGWQAALQQQWQRNGWLALAAQQQFPELMLQASEIPERQVQLNNAQLSQLLAAQSAALPSLISQSLRWLAKKQQFTPYLAVAEPWPYTENTQNAALAATPLLAGSQQNDTGQQATASLLAANLSANMTETSPLEQETFAGAVTPLSMLSWGILLAVLLLLVEWALLQRGRLP